MVFSRVELENKFENHKVSIIENINKATDMGVNKITAILVITEGEEEVKVGLVNWLITEGYKVSLKKEEYYIVTIEW